MSRLFHTLVVFGAGAALSGCGGQTKDSTGVADPNGDGGEGSGSGGTGGRASTSTGGIFSSGGRVATGGRPATGGMIGAGGQMILDETLAQWSCETLFPNCDDGDPAAGGAPRFVLDTPCPIDPTRPRTPAYCAGWFQCDLASFQGRTVAVDCHCVPVDPDGCTHPEGLSACDALTSEGWYRLKRQTGFCAEPVKLCGCAYTGILR